jgi:ABC-type bacteriocin/lantibiotic exporter with double-glycine peptidase domain
VSARPHTTVLRFLLDAVGLAKAATLLAVSAVMSLLDLLGIAVIFPYLDAVARPEARANQIVGSWFPHLDRVGAVLYLSAAILVLYLIKNVLQGFLMRYQWRQLAQLTQRLTNDMVALILRARYALFQKHAASGLAGIAYSNTVHAMAAFHALIQALNEVLFLGLLLIGFLLIQPLLALTLLAAFAVLGTLLYFLVLRRSTALGKAQSHIENVRYRLLFSIVGAIRDISIMGLGPLFDARSREVAAQYANVAWRYNFFGALPRLFVEFIALTGLIGFVAGYVWFDLSITAIAPALGVVVVAALRTVPAFSRLVASVHSYRFSEPVVERLIDARDELAAAQTSRREDALRFDQAIELRDVSFRYGESQTLRGIGMRIRRGDSVGIVGPSGSGKTTLLDLITGLQPAAGGEFLCDGQRFDPFTSRSMHGLIGYVPQTITLLDDSIAYNISFEVKPDAERLRRAIRIANLEQFVASLPEGVESQVGENGVRLSGGQRQRIGIARALYREPAILVFDEATSSLDAISERELTAEISQLRGGITKVIVTHRLSTIVDCDQIHVLSRGAVVDRGTHRELLARCALYRQLNAEEGEPVLQNATA